MHTCVLKGPLGDSSAQGGQNQWKNGGTWRSLCLDRRGTPKELEDKDGEAAEDKGKLGQAEIVPWVGSEDSQRLAPWASMKLPTHQAYFSLLSLSPIRCTFPTALSSHLDLSDPVGHWALVSVVCSPVSPTCLGSSVLLCIKPLITLEAGLLPHELTPYSQYHPCSNRPIHVYSDSCVRLLPKGLVWAESCGTKSMRFGGLTLESELSLIRNVTLSRRLTSWPNLCFLIHKMGL